jgi:hypothetical protein
MPLKVGDPIKLETTEDPYERIIEQAIRSARNASANDGMFLLGLTTMHRVLGAKLDDVADETCGVPQTEPIDP